MTDESAEIEDRTLPLDGWHRAHGARMVSFAGYQMPIQYDGIITEHQWTRSSAGLFDVSHMGQLLFIGDNADAALETLLPGDIKGLAEGKMRYSLLLSDSGGILDDLIVTRRVNDLYMVVNGATKADDIATLRDGLPDEITINHMEDQALLALQGPKAAAVLARLAPGTDALFFMEAGAFTIAGIPAWVSRSGYTGEDGFELSVPADSVEKLATLLCDQPEVKPVGLGARDSLRLEAGLPLYGHDVDPTTSPITSDLGFALSKRRREEGGFPGAEHILLEREQGAVQKRVGLFVDGRQPVREGAFVVDGEGTEVGRVTSGGHSPTLERAIAMAYVPTALAQPGTPITVSQRGKLHSCTVAATPFVPHRYHRKGSPK